MIESEVDKAQKYIDALPESVFSVGCVGTYRYVDIDDIIMESQKFVEAL
jgi:UDP-galactopyranose mutase